MAPTGSSCVRSVVSSANDEDDELCHGPFAAGLTRVFYVNQASHPDDGIILDADIEINAVDFALAKNCETTCETLGEGQPQDLENTLTHELGHLLGLGHTCWDGMDPPVHPEDDAGELIPFCEPFDALPESVLDATMYPYGDPTQIIKRSIEPDEVTAICEVYGTTPGEDVCTV